MTEFALPLLALCFGLLIVAGVHIVYLDAVREREKEAQQGRGGRGLREKTRGISSRSFNDSSTSEAERTSAVSFISLAAQRGACLQGCQREYTVGHLLKA